MKLIDWLIDVQSERSLRKEGSNRVQSLEAALQEAHDELKAEKLLLQEVCNCFAASSGLTESFSHDKLCCTTMSIT